MLEDQWDLTRVTLPPASDFRLPSRGKRGYNGEVPSPLCRRASRAFDRRLFAMSDTHRTPDPAQPEEARTPQGEASPRRRRPRRKKPGAFGADVYTWLQALVVAPDRAAALLHLLWPGHRGWTATHGPHPERRRPPLPPVRRL